MFYKIQVANLIFIFNKGYNNNVNIEEILELDIKTCNLLLVIIDTSTSAYNKYNACLY